MRGFDALRGGKVRGRTRGREWGAAIVWTLGGSELITHTTQRRRPEAGEATNRELTRRSR